MGRKERFLAKLAELAREYERPLRGKALVQTRLRWEQWEDLREEAVGMARGEIRRRKWRGARGGVLPGGVDAEDIAEQAIAELLGGDCRLVMGFTKQRVVGELGRLVSRRVRVLHGRREAAAVRSEWEAAPTPEGVEPVSIFAGLLDERAQGIGGSPGWEEAAAELKREIGKLLNGEPKLKELFDCLCLGVRSRAELARRLGLEEREVTRARKRLDRRLAAFAARHQR